MVGKNQDMKARAEAVREKIERLKSRKDAAARLPGAVEKTKFYLDKLEAEEGELEAGKRDLIRAEEYLGRKIEKSKEPYVRSKKIRAQRRKEEEKKRDKKRASYSDVPAGLFADMDRLELKEKAEYGLRKLRGLIGFWHLEGEDNEVVEKARSKLATAEENYAQGNLEDTVKSIRAGVETIKEYRERTAEETEEPAFVPVDEADEAMKERAEHEIKEARAIFDSHKADAGHKNLIGARCALGFAEDYYNQGAFEESADFAMSAGEYLYARPTLIEEEKEEQAMQELEKAKRMLDGLGEEGTNHENVVAAQFALELAEGPYNQKSFGNVLRLAKCAARNIDAYKKETAEEEKEEKPAEEKPRRPVFDRKRMEYETARDEAKEEIEKYKEKGVNTTDAEHCLSEAERFADELEHYDSAMTHINRIHNVLRQVVPDVYDRKIISGIKGKALAEVCLAATRDRGVDAVIKDHGTDGYTVWANVGPEEEKKVKKIEKRFKKTVGKSDGLEKEQYTRIMNAADTNTSKRALEELQNNNRVISPDKSFWFNHYQLEDTPLPVFEHMVAEAKKLKEIHGERGLFVPSEKPRLEKDRRSKICSDEPTAGLYTKLMEDATEHADGKVDIKPAEEGGYIGLVTFDTALFPDIGMLDNIHENFDEEDKVMVTMPMSAFDDFVSEYLGEEGNVVEGYHDESDVVANYVKNEEKKGTVKKKWGSKKMKVPVPRSAVNLVKEEIAKIERDGAWRTERIERRKDLRERAAEAMEKKKKRDEELKKAKEKADGAGESMFEYKEEEANDSEE